LYAVSNTVDSMNQDKPQAGRKSSSVGVT